MYKNAGDILPHALLCALQEYCEGELIYVPVRGERRAWGEKSGARVALAARNKEIRTRYAQGDSIERLAERYHLSVHTIRKIVKGTRRERL